MRQSGRPDDYPEEDIKCQKIRRRWDDRGSLREREKWADLQEMMIDAMTRFEAAISKRLQKIKTP